MSDLNFTFTPFVSLPPLGIASPSSTSVVDPVLVTPLLGPNEFPISYPSSDTKAYPTSPTPEDDDRTRRGPPAADTPGGDCKSLCIRHQRMANQGTNAVLQKSLETLSHHEQQAVNTVWSLFSAAPASRRLLILKGLLTIACPSQLSYLQSALVEEMRIDPLVVLPREIVLKIFGYLDAVTLGRAAQVNKTWKSVADDDVIWKTMCAQHIERKCEKCGWGLPLLGKKRKSKSTTPIPSPTDSILPFNSRTRRRSVVDQEDIEMMAESSEEETKVRTGLGEVKLVDDFRANKRAKTDSPEPALEDSAFALTPTTTLQTRPWKTVYCERLAIEKNWRRGNYSVLTLTGHTDSITCLQVSENLAHPNFPILMTGSWDRTIRIWNLDTGKEVGVIRGHSRGVRTIQFDAVKLVSGSMDGTIRVWNWRTGECLRILRGHTDAVCSVAFDRQCLVSGSADGTVRVWDFGTGEGGVLRGHTEWVNTVLLWDSNIDAPFVSHGGDLGQPTNETKEARESYKGKFVISASDDSTIRVWDLYTRECVRILRGHVAQVQSIRILAADKDSTCPFGSLATARSFIPGFGGFDTPASESLPPLNLLGSKKPIIVSASLDNTIKFWDVLNNTCERTMFGHIEGVWDVDIDKLRVVSGSHDRTLKIWDKESGKNLHTLVGHTGAVTAVTLRDSYAVSGSDDATAKVWRFN